jgi:hypothetical protein
MEEKGGSRRGSSGDDRHKQATDCLQTIDRLNTSLFGIEVADPQSWL